MLPRINEKLMRAKERVRAKRKLEAMLAEAQRQVQEQQQRCFKHRQLLGSEQAHVENLEGVSLMSLFFTILGTKSERLEKVNQEYLAANLKHAEAVEAAKFAQMEFDRLEQRLIEFRDADSEYVRLVEEKHRLLVETGDQRAEALGGLVERLVDLSADSMELQEAMQAGTAALESLERVLAELRSAEDVGTSDELGDDFKATKAKLSRIDTASQYAHAAQRLLRKFQEELADASLRLHVAVHIDRFSIFAESFFDGLISDWIVNSKIQAASSACGTTIAAVSATLAECRRQLTEVERNTESLTEQRRHFIEEA
jgi:hypothetical protein